MSLDPEFLKIAVGEEMIKNGLDVSALDQEASPMMIAHAFMTVVMLGDSMHKRGQLAPEQVVNHCAAVAKAAFDSFSDEKYESSMLEIVKFLDSLGSPTAKMFTHLKGMS